MKKSNRLVTAELQKRIKKKMPHFDQFPPPGEIDPYDVIVMSTSGPDDIFLKKIWFTIIHQKVEILSGVTDSKLTENCER